MVGFSQHCSMLLTINKRGNVRTNVTLRYIRIMIVAVEKQSVFRILIVCVYSITYSTRKVRASYCHLWPVCFDLLFHIISQKSRFSERKLLSVKCLFRFSLRLYLKYFPF